MTNNTLKITYAQADDHREEARARLQEAESGERGSAIEQDATFILNFEDFSEIEQLMRSSNLDLLVAIVDEQPDSIRQTADAVDRDYKEVHRNLEELEALGVIEYKQEGASKKPQLRGGAETIDFSFRIDPSTAGDRPTTPA